MPAVCFAQNVRSMWDAEKRFARRKKGGLKSPERLVVKTGRNGNPIPIGSMYGIFAYNVNIPYT